MRYVMLIKKQKLTKSLVKKECEKSNTSCFNNELENDRTDDEECDFFARER